MPTTSQPTSEPAAGRTFSLATMLLLTTVIAIFLAAGRVFIMGQNTIQGDEGAWRAVAGAVIGLVVGVTIALRRRRWLIGLGLAVLVGAPAGAAAGALLAEPLNMALVLVGSTLLVLLGVVVRKFSRTPVE